MSRGLREAIERGDYVIDPAAVAAAMIARARALRAGRAAEPCSEVLVAADEIEIRRIVAAEAQALPVERTA